MIASSEKPLDALIDLRSSLWIGAAAMACFVAVFGLWASLVPLATASLAPGQVSVEGDRQRVQHLSGGVVDQINVRDGDQVAAGQVLLRLRDPALAAERAELRQQLLQAEIEQFRWQAEQDGTRNLMLPERLTSLASAEEIEAARLTQQQLLNTRRKQFDDELHALILREVEISDSVVQAEKQLAALRAKGRLIRAELREHERLASEGLVTRAQRYDLNTQLANLRVDTERNQAIVDGAPQRLGALQAEQTALVSGRESEGAEALSRARQTVASLRLQLNAVEDQLLALDVRAPADGLVFDSQVNTIGSVVTPGATLMDIMPLGEKLLIECRVPARDRDAVRVGQAAEVRFNINSLRRAPPLQGVVRLVAADAENAEDELGRYYRTLVELNEDPGARLQGVEILPGMQADVLIVTGEQTLIQYLLAPLGQSFERALRES